MNEFLIINISLILTGIVAFVGTRLISIVSLNINLNLYITLILQVLYGGIVLLFFTFVRPPLRLSTFMIQHALSGKDISNNAMMRFVYKHYNSLLTHNAEAQIKAD